MTELSEEATSEPGWAALSPSRQVPRIRAAGNTCLARQGSCLMLTWRKFQIEDQPCRGWSATGAPQLAQAGRGAGAAEAGP